MLNIKIRVNKSQIRFFSFLSFLYLSKILEFLLALWDALLSWLFPYGLLHPDYAKFYVPDEEKLTLGLSLEIWLFFYWNYLCSRVFFTSLKAFIPDEFDSKSAPLHITKSKCSNWTIFKGVKMTSYWNALFGAITLRVDFILKFL